MRRMTAVALVGVLALLVVPSADADDPWFDTLRNFARRNPDPSHGGWIVGGKRTQLLIQPGVNSHGGVAHNHLFRFQRPGSGSPGTTRFGNAAWLERYNIKGGRTGTTLALRAPRPGTLSSKASNFLTHKWVKRGGGVALAAGMIALDIASGKSVKEALIDGGSTYAAWWMLSAADAFVYPLLLSLGPVGWVAAGLYTVGKIVAATYLGDQIADATRWAVNKLSNATQSVGNFFKKAGGFLGGLFGGGGGDGQGGRAAAEASSANEGIKSKIDRLGQTIE